MFIIVDKFTKWGYFIAYIEEILVEKVAQIYIKEVFARYGVLDKIILDRDILNSKQGNKQRASW